LEGLIEVWTLIAVTGGLLSCLSLGKVRGKPFKDL
jgi:hypothetical protein